MSEGWTRGTAVGVDVLIFSCYSTSTVNANILRSEWPLKLKVAFYLVRI
jgi:hypothetical protein